jgi:prepilin signal peptidase PulO-like enzyme (type II secretory pathway)
VIRAGIEALALSMALIALLPWAGGERAWSWRDRGLAGALLWTVIILMEWWDSHLGIRVALVVPWVAIALVDAREQEIPHRLVLASGVIGLLVTWDVHASLGSHLIVGLALGMGFLLLHAMSRARLGMGDVKFSVTLGIGLGGIRAVLAVSLAAWIAAATAIGILVTHRKHRKMAMAFAPFLSMAACLMLVTPSSMLGSDGQGRLLARPTTTRRVSSLIRSGPGTRNR